MGVFRRQRPSHHPNRRHLDRLHAMEKCGDPQRRGKTREDFVNCKQKGGGGRAEDVLGGARVDSDGYKTLIHMGLLYSGRNLYQVSGI